MKKHKGIIYSLIKHDSRNLIKDEVLAVTRGIKHWFLSGYSSDLPRIKFGVAGQESSPQSPTFHTAARWHSV